jgi:predicted Holliday junction resolvase-like endonuclease
MWLDKLVSIAGGVKNLVIIGFIVFIGFTLVNVKNDYMKHLEGRLKYEKTQAIERMRLEGLLKDMANANKKLMDQVEKRDAEAQQLRMDVGKSIRNFNRAVKELKNVKEPKESYDRLSDAWSPK